MAKRGKERRKKGEKRGERRGGGSMKGNTTALFHNFSLVNTLLNVRLVQRVKTGAPPPPMMSVPHQCLDPTFYLWAFWGNKYYREYEGSVIIFLYPGIIFQRNNHKEEGGLDTNPPLESLEDYR